MAKNNKLAAWQAVYSLCWRSLQAQYIRGQRLYIKHRSHLRINPRTLKNTWEKVGVRRAARCTQV